MKKIICLLFSVLLLLNQISVLAIGEDYVEKVTYLTFSKPSSSGYSDIVWVDENGNEVEMNNQSKTEKKGSFSAKSVLPKSYNSVNNDVVTDVKNQGVTGSCWAFSMISIAESSLISSGKVTKNDIDLSEAHHVWFTHKSYVEKNDVDLTSGDGTSVSTPYQAGGNWLRSTFSLARGMGFAKESDYPFNSNNESLMGNYSESARYVSNYRIKNSYTIPKEDTTVIKERIMSSGSVGVSIYMNSSYLNKTVGNYCYYYPTASSTNHQVTIVGWDDDYSSTNFKSSYQPSGNGAWIVKNSYGDAWGNNGYFYLSYYDKSIAYINTVDVIDSSDISTTYQYDGYGYSKSVTANNTSTGDPITTASSANVFKAEKTENVSSVSFYTTCGACDYKVEVYTGISSTYTNPTQNGKLVSTQSGTIKYDGYHTVDLTDLAAVTKDEYFSVVLTITSETAASIPFEGQSNVNDGSYTRYYASNSKESYYRFGTSTSWKESSTTNYNNVCIKAFTSSADTTEIKTPKDLADFSNAVNSGKSFKGKTVKLMNDISMHDSYFEPIGTAENTFEGVFDGNGKVIRNLNILKTENAGLFGVTGKSSVIKCVGLEGVSVLGGNNTGALAGVSNSSKIYNCYATGSVTGNENTGGLIGQNNSASTDNCFSTVSLYSDKACGILAGLDNSSYVNCFSLSNKNPVGGSESVVGINLCEKEKFENGYVSFKLQSDVLTWTKGENNPVLSQSEDYAVHMATIYNKTTSTMSYIYLTQYEDIYDLLTDEYPKKNVSVFTDFQAQTEFTGAVTFNRMLYIKLTDKTIVFTQTSDYSAENGFLLGVKQSTTALEFLSNFEKSSELAIYDNLGKKVANEDYIGSSFVLKLEDKNGEEISSLKIVVMGDLNSDGFIDAFDLSVLSAVANYEIDFETSDALFVAGDLTKDEYIDSFDASILTSVVNYEIEL